MREIEFLIGETEKKILETEIPMPFENNIHID